MKITFGIIVFFLTNLICAQNNYRYYNPDCKLSTSVKNPFFNKKQVESYVKTKLPTYGPEINGDIFLLIYIDKKGRSCCKHILNLTESDISDLNFFEIINNLPNWKVPSEKSLSRRKQISYSTLHFKICESFITIDTTNISALNLSNGYSIGDVKIENTNFKESPNKPQFFCEVFNKSNSPMPWDMSRSLSIDKQGNIWCGTDNGLLKIENNRMTVLNHLNSGLKQDVRSTEIKSKNVTNSILCSAVDSSDNKWFSDGYNLYKYDNVKWTVFDTTHLPIDWCTYISCSRENVLFATYSGILKVTNSIWEVLDSTNVRIPSNTVYTIFTDSEGNSWISTKGGNIYLKDSIPNNLTTTNSPLSNLTINCVAEDNSANIWFGTNRGGLIVLSKDKEWTTYNITNSNIPGNTILDIVVDKINNSIWLSIAEIGIVLFNKNNWYTFTINNSEVPSTYIPDIELDHNGGLWAATFAGLLHMRIIENNTP